VGFEYFFHWCAAGSPHDRVFPHVWMPVVVVLGHGTPRCPGPVPAELLVPDKGTPGTGPLLLQQPGPQVRPPRPPSSRALRP
jgi:hypothetical protein